MTLTLTLNLALTNTCPRGWRGQGGCGEEAVRGGDEVRRLCAGGEEVVRGGREVMEPW